MLLLINNLTSLSEGLTRIRWLQSLVTLGNLETCIQGWESKVILILTSLGINFCYTTNGLHMHFTYEHKHAYSKLTVVCVYTYMEIRLAISSR